jgi:glycosyltransferase involved in cell wall biosynthesis
LKVLKIKKRFTNKYSKIIDLSSKIIFISPWTIPELKKIFPDKNLTEKITLVPNIIELNELPNLDIEREKFVSVFNLDQYKLKNIRRVLLAFNELNKEYPEFKLDIIGRGKESSIKRIRKYIKNCTYPHNFSLLGPKPHEELLKLYGEYKGLILPSFPETFGMVFIEALNSGIPILYAKNSGIDGFFNDFKLGEKVHYNSVQEIKEAIEKIHLQNNEYLKSIVKLKKECVLKIFTRDDVKKKYSTMVSEILKNN